MAFPKIIFYYFRSEWQFFFGQFKWISQNKGLFSLEFPLKKQLYPHFKRVYYFGGDGAHSWVCTAQTNASKQKPTRYSRKNKKIVEVLVVFISFSTVSMRRNRGVCMCIYFYDVWCGIPKTRPHIPTFNICWSFSFSFGGDPTVVTFSLTLSLSLCALRGVHSLFHLTFYMLHFYFYLYFKSI